MASEVAKPPKKTSPVKTGYLTLYNAASAILWGTVLGRVVGANAMRGPAFTFLATGNFVKWTQTLMIMDIVHAATGIVRTAVTTTGLQVASRLVLIWGVQYAFPNICSSPGYSSMLFAWSLTEVIRYSYLALKLSGWEPFPFFWVRYSSFIILYPVGIASEMWMMYKALGFAASQQGQIYQLFLKACLFVIWPWGAWVMINHMIKQRRKVLQQAKAKDVKATQ